MTNKASKGTPSTPQTVAMDIPALFITFFSLISALYIPNIDHSFLLLIGLLIIPGQMLSLRIRLPLYHSAWNIISIVFIVAILVWRLVADLPAQAVLGYICLFLLVHRWYTRRRNKEHLEIWGLSTLILMAAGMELSGPVGLLILVSWSIATIQLFNLRSVFHSAKKTTHQNTPAPYHLAPYSLRSLWACIPILLALTIIIFFASPRIRPYTLKKNRSTSAGTSVQAPTHTGYSETISLRTMTNIRQDNTPVFRLMDPPPSLTTPQVRFRLSTLDLFDGWTWQRSESVNSPSRSLASQGNTPLILSEEHKTTENEITKIPLEWYYIHLINYHERIVPLPEKALFLLGLEDNFPLSVGQDGRVMATTSNLPKEFEILVSETTQTPLMTSPVQDSHLAIPEKLKPIIKEKALDLFNEKDDWSASKKAHYLVSWFRRQGQYSLELKEVPEGPAGIKAFLASTPTGHCELFSTAMALLLRAEGVPTRIVTGFAGAQEVPSLYGGRRDDFLVRNSNAHAWVEVYTEDGHWKSFDPTPAVPMSNLQISQGVGNNGLFNQSAGEIATAFDEYNYDSQSRFYSNVIQSLDNWVNEWEHGALVTAWYNIKQNIKQPSILFLMVLLVLFNIMAHYLYYRFAIPHRIHKVSRQLLNKDLSLHSDLFLTILAKLKVSRSTLERARVSSTPGETIRSAALAAGFSGEKASRLAELYTTWRYREKNKELEQEMMRLLRG